LIETNDLNCKLAELQIAFNTIANDFLTQYEHRTVAQSSCARETLEQTQREVPRLNLEIKIEKRENL